MKRHIKILAAGAVVSVTLAGVGPWLYRAHVERAFYGYIGVVST